VMMMRLAFRPPNDNERRRVLPIETLTYAPE
jgi:hypothetical protein